MKVIKPIAITGTLLVSSTASETYATYSAGTAYALNTRTIYAGRTWECIQGPSTGNRPDVSPLYWFNFGPSNTQAMFDTEISTATAAATTLSVVLKPGLCNSLALFGLVGTTLTITVRDSLGGTVVNQRTINLDGTLIDNWYQYFFEPAVQLTSVVLTDLPPYSDAHITVTIAGAVVRCGHLVVGTAYDLGGTEYGASFGITDYSRKETSATGVSTLVKRKFARKLSASLTLGNNQINKISQVLEDLRATPCAWIGTDVPGYESLTVFGFYSDFSVTVQYATQSLCNLEIQGLV